MENFLYLPIVLILVAAYKAASNYCYLRRIRAFHQLHTDFIRELGKPKGKGKPGWAVIEGKHEIVQLFKRAGVKDSEITRVEFVGYGHVAPQTMSLFDNIAVNDKEILTGVQQRFHEAEGVYENRIREAIDPFYWIDAIVFLPGELTQYLGVPAGSWIGRTLNMVGWLTGIAGLIFALPDFQDLRDGFSTWLASIRTYVGL